MPRPIKPLLPVTHLAMAVALFALPVGPVTAQVARGEMVRVTELGRESVEGTVIEQRGDTLSLLLLGSDEAWLTTLGTHTKLEVWERRSVGRGMVSRGAKAFVGGMVGGAILGGLLLYDEESMGSTRGNAAAAFGFWFAFTAFPIGAVIGAINPGEHWQEIGAGPGVVISPAPNGAVRLGYSVRF